jgi:hypothetical protein
MVATGAICLIIKQLACASVGSIRAPGFFGAPNLLIQLTKLVDMVGRVATISSS